MYPKGDQLYLIHCVGVKGFWVEETRCHLSTAHITAAFNTAPPEKNYHNLLRKSVHFLFCCFKASIFAYPLVQCCNRVGKAPPNTNHCCLLAAQTRAALVAFGAKSSILTAGLFLSQCCPLLVTPKHSKTLQTATTICCRKKY